jgi:hypothetical protein
MEDDSIIFNELSLLAFNIRREVINVLDSFISFLKKYENRKTHNMIFLMLNPRLKSLHIISSFVGREQGVALVEEYDRKSLYPMLVKCHEHLHPLVRLDTNYVNQDIFEQDCNLNIFEQTTNTSEPVEELVKMELLVFRKYQLDVKDIKCPRQWRQKHEAMFPTIRFLTQIFLGVVGSQIEVERIFSLIGIFIDLRRCHLQTENLEKLIFVNKNWSNEPRIGCKSPSNLVEFLEKDVVLKEELKEFEAEFERDEVVEV